MQPVSPFLKYNEFCRLYLKFENSGMKRSEIFTTLVNMGYDKAQKTLDRHVRDYKANGSALLEEKKAGRMPKLDDDQLEDVHEWILDQNEHNNPFKRDDIQKFIYETWSIQVTPQYVSLLLARLGHTLRTCQTKTSGFKKLNSVLREEYWAFILALKSENKLAIPASNIHSIDVTYTKKPVQKVTTFAPRGGPKPKSSKKVKLYTNAIVTMINASGKNVTPCVLFTFDPRMGPGTNGPVGKAKREHFMRMLAKFGIAEDRIIYKKSLKHLYAECPDMYELFLKRYKAQGVLGRADLFLHDGGRAFKRKKVSIFDSLKLGNHVTYPADVHQYLSPNDNKLHGCKAKWAAEYYKFEDEISPSLRLMQLIDLETTKHSKKYFGNNLLNVKKSDLVDIIGS